VALRDELESGRDAFAHLIRVWHERNGWSQRVLPALAERLELGRVHNSQLSNLRNRKLASPGPELFVALGRLSQLLAAQQAAALEPPLDQRLEDSQELLQALRQSDLSLLADDGTAFGPAQLLKSSWAWVPCRWPSIGASPSWKLSNSLETELSLDSLEMAFASGCKPEIFQSDQGCYFTSGLFVGRLQEAVVKISWSGRKRCYDNILVERLWRTFKYEEAYLRTKSDGRDAQVSLAVFLWRYGHVRPHG
jgi:hypothetical protein